MKVKFNDIVLSSTNNFIDASNTTTPPVISTKIPTMIMIYDLDTYPNPFFHWWKTCDSTIVDYYPMKPPHDEIHRYRVDSFLCDDNTKNLQPLQRKLAWSFFMALKKRLTLMESFVYTSGFRKSKLGGGHNLKTMYTVSETYKHFYRKRNMLL